MSGLSDFLITDRTMADVDRVKYLSSLWGPAPGQWRGTREELTEWSGGLKGAFNAADLNRLTMVANYLLTRLKESGYKVPEAAEPKTWAVGEIPTPPEMADFLGWISAVRASFHNVGGFPELPPNMDGLTFEKANDIEWVLLTADRNFDNMKKSRVYSGEFQSGGV